MAKRPFTGEKRLLNIPRLSREKSRMEITNNKNKEPYTKSTFRLLLLLFHKSEKNTQ